MVWALRTAPLAPEVGGRGGSEGTWRPKTPCSQAWLPILSGVEVTRSEGLGLPPSRQQACRDVLAGNFCREGNASSPHPIAAQLLWKVSHPSRAPPVHRPAGEDVKSPTVTVWGVGPSAWGSPERAGLGNIQEGVPSAPGEGSQASLPGMGPPPPRGTLRSEVQGWGASRAALAALKPFLLPEQGPQFHFTPILRLVLKERKQTCSSKALGVGGFLK